MSTFDAKLKGSIKSGNLETDSKGRVFYFDNLKFWLMVLVLIGHFINPATPDYDIYQNIFMFIYTFHMPLFIFVTGYFAKSVMDRKTGRFKLERVLQFAVFYVFLNVTVFLINYYLLDDTEPFIINFLTPINPEWYLMSTMICFLIIPLVRKISPRYVIPVSIVIALLAGFTSEVSDFLTLSRSICFFPFFIAGYYMTQNTVVRIITYGGNKLRILSVIFVIVFLALCLWDPVHVYALRRVVSPHYFYSEIEVYGDLYNILGPIVRLIWYSAVALISIAFMKIIPTRETLYTEFGKRTLQIYMIHPLVIRLLNFAGLYDLIGAHSQSWLYLIIPIVIGFILTYLLSWKPLGTPFNKVLSWNFGLGKKNPNS
jgi:fucose 4-O-acetylase-like acetyltransferase